MGKDLAIKNTKITTSLKSGHKSVNHKFHINSPYLDASGNKNIGATIRIGQEIRCLQNAGFFSMGLKGMVHMNTMLVPNYGKWIDKMKKLHVFSDMFNIFPPYKCMNLQL